MKIKSMIVLLSILWVSACGSSSDAKEVKSIVEFVESDSVVTIDNSDEYDKTILFVTGSRSSVTVNSRLEKLDVSGSNNIIQISSGVIVEECVVEGDDNTLSKDEGVEFTCQDLGMGNTGF